MSARYITTSLPYVNADLHLGHALEFLEADFLARALRAQGSEVFFNTGTDEHGAKVAEKAKEEGADPQTYVDEYSARAKAFADKFQISYDSFIRTTDPAHVAAAQAFWTRCKASGDIYKAMYEVKYCIGCELEKTDSELENGHCILHPNLEIEIREEENYYFKFSKYEAALLAHYASQKDFVVPEERMRELTSFVSFGLKDFSISRRREKLAWGVPVPDDEEHVMYVWFDALVNYVSAIGWPDEEERFLKWWPVTQLAGKDNLRQQASMWQAMLLSAGLPFSRNIFIHGFITSGGQKMSKSLGNVINPLELVKIYGVDAVRYILLRHVSHVEDSDLTLDGIREYYTAHLANGLGNFVARVMKLAQEHLLTPIELRPEDMSLEPVFMEKIEQFRFNEAMDSIFEHVGRGDAYMTEQAPYKKIKSDNAIEQEAARKDIEKLIRHLAKVAAHLTLAMPTTANTILDAIRSNTKPENLFPRVLPGTEAP